MTEAPGPGANVDVETLAYDDAFAELQRVVAALEAGGGTLEATIARLRAGRRAPAPLRAPPREAELRVQQLMTRPGGAVAARSTCSPEDAEEDPG